MIHLFNPFIMKSMVLKMEQDPAILGIPKKAKQNTPMIQYSIGFRGVFFLILGISVLLFGFVGYLEYDRLVKPYFREFICCVPTFILALILFFLGFATRISTVRQVKQKKPSGKIIEDQSIDRGKIVEEKDIKESMKTPPVEEKTTKFILKDDLQRGQRLSSIDNDLTTQRKEILQFLKSLDEQYKDGLIMDGAYFSLKNKYRRELSNLNLKLKTSSDKNIKKLEK